MVFLNKYYGRASMSWRPNMTRIKPGGFPNSWRKNKHPTTPFDRRKQHQLAITTIHSLAVRKQDPTLTTMLRLFTKRAHLSPYPFIRKPLEPRRFLMATGNFYNLSKVEQIQEAVSEAKPKGPIPGDDRLVCPPISDSS